VEDNAMLPPASSYPFYPPVSFNPGYIYGNNMYSAPGYNGFAQYPMDMRYQQPVYPAQMGYQT